MVRVLSSSTPAGPRGQGGDASADSSSGGADTGGVEAGEAGGTACTGSGGCSGSTPVCCATVPLTPACTSDAPAAVCKTSASCATSVGMRCSGTQTVRLCGSNSDCTEPAFNLCCFFLPIDAGASLQFCANQTIAAFAGAGAVCQSPVTDEACAMHGGGPYVRTASASRRMVWTEIVASSSTR